MNFGTTTISDPAKNGMHKVCNLSNRRSHSYRPHCLARFCSLGLLLSAPAHLEAFLPHKLHRCASTLKIQSTPTISSASVGSVGIMRKRNSSPPRSAVIQPYRIEDEYASSSDPVVSQPKQSDVFSFLPARFSSIQRLETPSQFQSKVLDKNDSLAVVRFYADACPSCRATGPMFRKWSRDHIEQNGTGSIESIKFLEMPLTKATSDFFQYTLEVDKLPTYRLYHPKLGLVEEHVVVKKSEFNYFVEVVNGWVNDDVDTRDMNPSRRRTVFVNHVVKVDYESKRENEYDTGSGFQ
ncbi:hypothetical protein ACHAXS_013638 [Conticribra weissflogii]